MRPTWRDGFATAADLALLGFLVTLAALPVVTAGAAVLTGSRAVSLFVHQDRWPSVRECGETFRRALLPGLAGSVVVVAAAGLLAADLIALGSGDVPGGVPMMVVVCLVAAAVGGLVALTVVAAAGHLVRDAFRVAWRTATTRPRTLFAAAGVTGLAVLLAVLVHPVLTPVLAGFGLFALHVVVRDQPVTENELVTKSLPPAEEVIS